MKVEFEIVEREQRFQPGALVRVDVGDVAFAGHVVAVDARNEIEVIGGRSPVRFRYVYTIEAAEMLRRGV